MLVTSALISGLGLGSMYGLLALGFYVTYAVSSTVNFAQGSSMMLGAVFAYTFAVTLGWPFVAAALLALALCALYGMLVEMARGAAVRAPRLERLADGDRRARHRRRQHGAVHLRQGAARVSLAVGDRIVQVGGHRRLAAADRHPGRRSRARRRLALVLDDARGYGKAMLAVVQNPDAARLMGINVPRRDLARVTLPRRVFAGAAGILIAPLFNVHSDMGTLFGLKAFAVAILGGITSAWGVMLAGLLFGSSKR